MTVTNHWYSLGLAAIGNGDVVLVDPLVLYLISEDHVFDDTMSTVADVDPGDILSAPESVLGTLAMSGRTLVTDVAVTTLPDVPSDPSEVGAVLLTTDGATDADKVLLHLWQREGDVELVVVTDGGDVEIEFIEETDTALFGIVRI